MAANSSEIDDSSDPQLPSDLSLRRQLFGTQMEGHNARSHSRTKKLQVYFTYHTLELGGGDVRSESTV